MSIKKSAKKRNQKVKLFIIGAIAILVLAVITVYLSIAATNIGKLPTSTESNETSNHTVYTLISNDEFNTILAHSDMVIVYIGRPTCPHCATFSPLLLEVIQETGTLVYHYDTDAAKADDPDKRIDILTKLNITTVPTLAKIQNGSIITELEDYTSRTAIRQFLTQ